MKDIWRILRFTKELKSYYVGISVFTVLLAIMTQLTPLLTKGAVDEIAKLVGGGEASVALVALFATLLFLTDVGQTFVSNIGAYIGDMMSVKLQQLLSQRYYQHVLSLPQRYFDTE